jgi:hypothetical protein
VPTLLHGLFLLNGGGGGDGDDGEGSQYFDVTLGGAVGAVAGSAVELYKLNADNP